mgnify:CR=1 FL=1
MVLYNPPSYKSVHAGFFQGYFPAFFDIHTQPYPEKVKGYEKKIEKFGKLFQVSEFESVLQFLLSNL